MHLHGRNADGLRGFLRTSQTNREGCGSDRDDTLT